MCFSWCVSFSVSLYKIQMISELLNHHIFSTLDYKLTEYKLFSFYQMKLNLIPNITFVLHQLSPKNQSNQTLIYNHYLNDLYNNTS